MSGRLNKSSYSDHSPEARVLAYCHDSVGLGHFHRTLAICERVRKTIPASTFMIATGTPYVPIFELPYGVDYIKLPALTKTGRRQYVGKYLISSGERVLSCRQAMLLGAAQSFEPAVVLVDKAPAGVCGELLPTLHWLRRHRPQTRIVFGMRDIEDDPASTIAQWTTTGALTALAQCYDEIWVYGMQAVFDVVAKYRLPSEITSKLHYVGYVVQDPCCHEDGISRDDDNILVTVGGGTDGEAVLDTFVRAASKLARSHAFRSTIVGGPDLPSATSRKLRLAAAEVCGLTWLDHVPCMHCRIRNARVVVTMGGYNTLCEVVFNRKPAVVIPRTSPRVEQMLRARLWSSRAELDVINPAELTPDVLTLHIKAHLQNKPRRIKPDLDFTGLDRVCARFGDFWNTETGHAAAVCVH